MPTQVTLVSLYGQKRNPEFVRLIAQSQKVLTDALAGAFTPYDEMQIHATIVGLERSSPTAFENENFAKFRNRKVTMDFDGFLDYVRTCGHFPFQVQLGGFQDRPYPFTSRNARPYERSFSIQGDKAVVMGWPVRGTPFSTPEVTREVELQESRIYTTPLDSLRLAAQRFGILHGYHRALTAVDNDLFFRIGLVDQRAVPLGSIPILESQLRQLLSREKPLVIEITLDDLFVVAYDDNTLPPDSKCYCVTNPEIDGTFVSKLYE